MYIQSDSIEYRLYLKRFYTTYGSIISTLQNKVFNDENIREYSCTIYKIYQYYIAFQLGYLIKTELNRGINTSLSYYEEKYSLETKRKLLACNGISLDTIYTIFDIVFDTPIIVPIDMTNFTTEPVCYSIFTCENIEHPEDDIYCNHCTN